MKFTRQLFDLPSDAMRPSAQPSQRRGADDRRPLKPLVMVTDWDPTAGAKRLLWIGLLGMLLCALVFSGLNTLSEKTQYMNLSPLVVLAYLVFTFAGLASVWIFLRGMWRYLFPRMLS